LDQNSNKDITDSKSISENEKVSKPISENEKVSKTISENEKVSKPISENEKVSKPISENVKVSKTISENEKVSKPISENEKVSKPISENEKVSKPISENEKVSKPISENVKVSKTISENEKVSKEISSKANVNLFKYHLRVLDEGARILLLATTNIEEDLNNIATLYAGNFKHEVRIEKSSETIQIKDEYDLVLVSDFSNGEARNTHFRIDKRNVIDVPIVFGFARPLFFNEPNFKVAVTGISYAGMFKLANQYLKSVKEGQGDYIEFGVFDGRTVSLAYHTLKSSVNRFFAFDSYEGLIGTTETEESNFKDGQYFSTVATFNHNMEVAKVDKKRIIPVKGDFLVDLNSDLLEKHNIIKCKCVHIDCDIYAPAKAALNFVKDVLVNGALILLDDYDQFGASNYKGERRAVKEWLEENPEIELIEYRSYSVFCRAFIFWKKD